LTTTGDRNLFRTDAWRGALEKYSAATHLTVVVTGLDGAWLLEPRSSTPVFDVLAGRPGLFAECARRCLGQVDGALGPVVEERYGVAVVGAPLRLDGTLIGAAVAGYVVTAFPDQRSTQRLAQASNAPFADLWRLLRQQLPLAHERLLVYGELLQTLCDTLLSEHHRTQQLETASARLTAESEAKDRFLAVLSHELRTPLTAMLGWVLMLRNGKLSETATARGLDVIERNTRLQAQLIEDLLHVSRIVSGRVELNLRPLGLAAIVDATVETFRPTADAKGLRLDVVLDPAAGLVSADPDRIEQVISNLVSNAIKFTPTGGRVDVRLAKNGGEVEISVADTGTGIPATFLPHVFDRFSQADGAPTRAYGGLGLGLAIVRHLVELHGGRVQAASRGKGQGATFTVWLPALAATDAGGSEQRARTAEGARPVDDVPTLEGVRVLLVDDEADARELFKGILEQHKIEVAAVSSVEEALRLMAHWRPDVLVSDLGMTTESGYDLIRTVRRLTVDEGARIPALALTAYAGSENSRLALAAGFQLHLAKPVEPTALALAVARLAGRMKAA
jgi:signal transduction histidine kinase/CheY-like chemotaxis protein